MQALFEVVGLMLEECYAVVMLEDCRVLFLRCVDSCERRVN